MRSLAGQPAVGRTEPRPRRVERCSRRVDDAHGLGAMQVDWTEGSPRQHIKGLVWLVQGRRLPVMMVNGLSRGRGEWIACLCVVESRDARQFTGPA